MSQRDCVDRETARFKGNGLRRAAVVRQPAGVECQIAITDVIADRMPVGAYASKTTAVVVRDIEAAIGGTRTGPSAVTA